MNSQQIKAIARTLAASLATNESVRFVAAHGYKETAGLPSHMTEAERFELLNAIQDEAKEIEATL